MLNRDDGRSTQRFPYNALIDIGTVHHNTKYTNLQRFISLNLSHVGGRMRESWIRVGSRQWTIFSDVQPFSTRYRKWRWTSIRLSWRLQDPVIRYWRKTAGHFKKSSATIGHFKSIFGFKTFSPEVRPSSYIVGSHWLSGYVLYPILNHPIPRENIALL